jgi:hypothetical protein
MKDWWQDYRSAVVGLAGIFFAVFLFVIVIAYVASTRDHIIFDSAKQEIKQKISFATWLADWWGPGERYLFIREKSTLVGTANNMAYKAEFRLPRNNQSIQKYLADTTPEHRKFWVGFEDTVMRCIEDVARQNYKIDGNPLMTVRAMSIANMNEICPLASRFGYVWADSLEIAQCSKISGYSSQEPYCSLYVKNALYH